MDAFFAWCTGERPAIVGEGPVLPPQAPAPATSPMQTYSTMTLPMPLLRSPILPPPPQPPQSQSDATLAPPAPRAQHPAWFIALSSAVQKELRAMVDAIERDSPSGWCNETEIDLQNEFNLSHEQARAIFRCLCSAPLAARLDAERAAEAAGRCRSRGRCRRGYRQEMDADE